MLFPALRKRLKLIVIGLAAATTAGLVSLLVFTPWYGSEEPVTGQIRSVTSDEEWIALIRQAKQIEENGWKAPPPHVPPGTALVSACAELPSTVQLHQVFNQPGPAGHGQTMFEFVDTASPEKYLLIVGWTNQTLVCEDDALTTELARAIQDGIAQQQTINAHICDEMRLMAAGESKTDPTVRSASPPVARQYLDAFCE